MFAALSTLMLLIATYAPSFVINILSVTVAAIATAMIIFDDSAKAPWALMIYFVTVLLTFALGGLSRPMALLAYSIIVGPYFIFHIWADEYLKNYFLRWLLKFIVMTALCLLFFLALSPLFPTVKMVLDAISSLPMKWFGVNKIQGEAISLSACALSGGATIPLVDLFFRYVKKLYIRVRL